jgi:hypothetical protein
MLPTVEHVMQGAVPDRPGRLRRREIRRARLCIDLDAERRDHPIRLNTRCRARLASISMRNRFAAASGTSRAIV